MLETNNIFLRIILIACFATTVSASWWDDFTNNLATDLTPLIALFGEQATKQFLSESTTVLDNFIFAMAPLGILTGVVSAIRVCGGPSLRAFIGRAQEGGGIAEAELCSSTSRDVCELYHNGAIVRVFGRPKILEIIYDPTFQTNGAGENNNAFGIHISREYFQKAVQNDTYWEEKGVVLDDEAKSGQLPARNAFDNFAPNPNLSLNIGIVKRSSFVYIGAAIIGFLAQASVLVLGAFVKYKLRWKKNENPIDPWAFPFIFTGTIFVCFGMFLCATLVNESTKERVFKKKNVQDGQNSSPGPILYVVQPGNQVVGDQTFDPFLFFKTTDNYMTSWKVLSSKDSTFGLQQGSKINRKDQIFRNIKKPSEEILVLLATFITILGFGLQFVGLRAMHSIVSLLQLGVTILMSVIRALLRTQRLSIEGNVFRDRPDEVSGHELDWLALQIAKDENDSRYFWNVTGNMPSKILQQSSGSIAQRALEYRSRLAELTGQLGSMKPRVSNAWDDNQVSGRLEAQQLKKAIEESIAIFIAGAKPKIDVKNVKTIPWCLTVAVGEEGKISPAAPNHQSINVPLKEQNSIWTVDHNLLEAIIGLWSWSIISDPCVEGETFGFKTSTASDIPIYRAIAAGNENEIEQAWRDIQFWIGSPDIPRSTFYKRDQSLGELDANATTIWRQGKPIVADESRSSTSTPLFGKSDSYQRLIGWHGIDIRKGPTIAATRIKSKHIPTFCSQDIYQSFLCTIAACFEPDGESTTVIKKEDIMRFEQQLVSKLIDCFVASGLGSRQDASLIIIPSLRNHSILPHAAKPILAAYRIAEELRKDGNFKKSEGVLRWAWEAMTELGETRDVTLIELGELYRYALFSDDWQDFGKEGIKWMDSCKGSSLSHLESEVIARYVELERRPRESRTGRHILDAVLRNKREETLWSMSQLGRGDFLIDTESSRTVLSYLSQKGWFELVKAALEIGSVVDAVDDQGRTPLSYAAEYGHVSIVSILMEANALPIAEDSSRRTPLSYAAGEGHVSVMENLLSDVRVNVYTKDIRNRSPLHWAAENGENDAIRCLVRHGAQIDDADRDEFTPLMLALLNNLRRKVDRRQTAELLLQMKSKVDVTIHSMKSWEWALQESEFICAEFLLENNEDGMTPAVLVGVGRRDVIKKVSLPLDCQFGFKIRAFTTTSEEKEITMGEIQEIMAKNYHVVVHEVANGLSKSTFNYDEYKMLDMLLDDPQEMAAMAKIIEAAVKDRENGDKVISMILHRQRVHFQITEEVVKALYQNKKCGRKIIALLLRQRGDRIHVMKEAVSLIIKIFDLNTVALLFRQPGAKVELTEEVLKAAATNEGSGNEIIALILDQWGDQVQITEQVLKAASANLKLGKEIMTLILKQRGNQVQITEEVLKAVAANESSGEAIMALILD